MLRAGASFISVLGHVFFKRPLFPVDKIISAKGVTNRKMLEGGAALAQSAAQKTVASTGSLGLKIVIGVMNKGHEGVEWLSYRLSEKISERIAVRDVEGSEQVTVEERAQYIRGCFALFWISFLLSFAMTLISVKITWLLFLVMGAGAFFVQEERVNASIMAGAVFVCLLLNMFLFT